MYACVRARILQHIDTHTHAHAQVYIYKYIGRWLNLFEKNSTYVYMSYVYAGPCNMRFG